ncbi:MAG: DUF190 domain-containing protein [Methylomicrobium sp.]|nr:DUF190 domain-containing protein [Methylomicrobium sp.]
MKSKPVTVVRIYALEGKANSGEIVDMLRNEQAISGVSVFRAIEGYGEDREMHTTSLLALSMDLPVVVEFYDEPEKAENAIIALRSRFDLPHIVTWPAAVPISVDS